MIKSFKCVNLNNHLNTELNFNPDLNILTGINGAGKTTVLKTIWLLISGNLDSLFSTVTFEEISLHTDKYSISIFNKDNEFSVKENILLENEKTYKLEFDKRASIIKIDDLKDRLSRAINESIYFPTFRRVEGGYIPKYRNFSTINSEGIYRRRRDENEDLDEALTRYSEALSVRGHRFISSLSTNDIKQLLIRKDSEISALSVKKYTELAREIVEKVNQKTQEKNAEAVLQEIKEAAEAVSRDQERMRNPFTVLSKSIDTIFNNKGIKITDYLSLGTKIEDTIDSSFLSAGEKQMLSFLCYNIFVSNSPIFIDEPELSLHVDWQRLLFSILMEQETNNQFFIATHSPSIYAKFADKEIELGDMK